MRKESEPGEYLSLLEDRPSLHCQKISIAFPFAVSTFYNACLHPLFIDLHHACLQEKSCFPVYSYVGRHSLLQCQHIVVYVNAQAD